MDVIAKLRAKRTNFLRRAGILLELASISRDFFLRQELETIREKPRYSHAKNLIHYGYKLYSQFDEDGILQEIFSRIGTTNKTFVEFGVGDGLENNTLALMFEDWNGLWIEGSQAQCEKIQLGFQKTIATGQLTLINSFITAENINELISTGIRTSEIDLLSIDIDGNDYHVLRAIQCVTPRVIVIEYNAKFPPHIQYCMRYDPSFIGGQTDNFGASLKFLELKLESLGYSLVGCSLTGINAFFIRTELINDAFQGPFTAEQHYEPARYKLIYSTSGHKASYLTLENRMQGGDQ